MIGLGNRLIDSYVYSVAHRGFSMFRVIFVLCIFTALSFCQSSYAQPQNDDCVNAISIALGATPIDNSQATPDAEIASCAGGSGIWYEYDPVQNGNLVVSLCGSSFDTSLSLWDSCGGAELSCNDDFCGLQSEQSIAVVSGQAIFIQVDGFNGAQGSGSLELSMSCGDLEPLNCSYDCSTSDVSLSWSANAYASSGYEIYENGVLVGSAPAGSTSYTVLSPPLGLNTYDIIWPCDLGGAGQMATCDVNVIVPVAIANGTSELILQLEGLNSAGDRGAIDSGLALEEALLANGLGVDRVSVANIDQLIWNNCLDLDGVTTLWVLAGTFPNDYQLSQGEGDILAAIAASNVGIYLESGDHWGFNHIHSELDLRDGIAPDSGLNILDGDDSFTQMDGAATTSFGIDFSAYENVNYGQDSLAGNDSTDVLSLHGTDPHLAPDSVFAADAIWRNSNDGLPDPNDPDESIAYITGVYASHNDGGFMISQSWEFGGFALDQANPSASDSDRAQLASEYWAAISGDHPHGDTLFLRGDCNSDSTVDIADVIHGLGSQFPSAAPIVLDCEEACDANGDQVLNIADIISTLSALFGPNTVPLPAPYPNCGFGEIHIACNHYMGFCP